MIVLALVIIAVLIDWIMLLVVHPHVCLIPNGLSCWLGFYPVPNGYSMAWDSLLKISPAPLLNLLIVSFCIAIVLSVNGVLAKWRLDRAVQIGFAVVTAGAVSNAIQVMINSSVYDWIVVPAFGDWWIMTIGDIVMMIGVPVTLLLAFRGMARDFELGKLISERLTIRTG